MKFGSSLSLREELELWQGVPSAMNERVTKIGWLVLVAMGLACQTKPEPAGPPPKTGAQILEEAKAACAQEQVDEARRILVEGGKTNDAVHHGLSVAGIDAAREGSFNPCGVVLVVVGQAIAK